MPKTFPTVVQNKNQKKKKPTARPTRQYQPPDTPRPSMQAAARSIRTTSGEKKLEKEI
jgi:hypothetical protein